MSKLVRVVVEYQEHKGDPWVRDESIVRRIPISVEDEVDLLNEVQESLETHSAVDLPEGQA